MVGDLASLTFRLGTCRALSAPAVTSSLRAADKTDFRAAAQPLRGNCFSGFRAKTFHPSPYLYKRDAPPKSARRSTPRALLAARSGSIFEMDNEEGFASARAAAPAAPRAALGNQGQDAAAVRLAPAAAVAAAGTPAAGSARRLQACIARFGASTPASAQSDRPSGVSAAAVAG